MKHICKAALVAAMSTIVTPAFAVPLDPGTVIFPTGTTAADPVQGGILVVQEDNLIGFQHDPTPVTPFTNIGGEVQSRVALNPFATLTFLPRIRDTYNIDGGTFAILGFSVDGYAGYDVDVDYRTDGPGDKGFSSVSRSLTGDLMTFRFDSPLFVDSINPPGRQEESLFPSILTDATAFKNTGTMRIVGEILPLGADAPSGSADNLFSITVDGIAAPATIPVPAAGLLLIGGLGLLGGIARSKRRMS